MSGREPKAIPPLTPAQRKLADENRRLVEIIIKKEQRRLHFSEADLADIMQDGYIELCKAATRFDETRGVSFATFASHYIKHTVGAHFKKVDWASERSRDIYKKAVKLSRESGQDDTGKPRLCFERAVDRIVPAKKRGMAAFVKQMRNGGDVPLDEAFPVADSGPTLDSVVEQAQTSEALGRAMQTLPEKHRRILEEYYGHEKSDIQIKALLGLEVSTQRMQQMRKEALYKLRTALDGQQESLAIR